MTVDLNRDNQADIEWGDQPDQPRAINADDEEDARARLNRPPDFAFAAWALLPPNTKLSSLRSLKKSAPEKSAAPSIKENTATDGKKSKRVFQVSRNRDTNGELLEKLSAKNVDACQQNCRADANCKSFTFNAWNKLCLKKGPATLQWLEPSSTSGYLQGAKLPKESPVEITVQRYRGKKLPGTGYKTLNVATEQSCFDLCKSDKVCLAYVFARSQNSCAMMKSAGEYSSNAEFDSGVKKQLN